MNRQRKTVAQALITYLKNQYTSRDGVELPLFGGCLGIFGHGNVAGLGHALFEDASFRFVPFRNEQAMVHSAIGYARVNNRMSTLVCTSSIGPGATNMITGAALATINRLPVLLLPGDIFATRRVFPVLQQLESHYSQDISVNDCFKPVSKYWDRINRPEQIIHALPQAIQVLTSPAETGAVTLSLPQDVQTEVYDFPEDMFQKRIWLIERPLPDKTLLKLSIEAIRKAKRPVIIAGGGVIYSSAAHELKLFVEQTGIPVVVTMAGKGSLSDDHSMCLGSVGVTGTPGGVAIPSKADLIIGLGTRYTDFTTSSKTLFQHSEVRFINVNIAEGDAGKLGATYLRADIRETIKEWTKALRDWRVSVSYQDEVTTYRSLWSDKKALYLAEDKSPMTQAAIIGIANKHCQGEDIMVAASGSLPGDLHKLWNATKPGTFHVEYGYSCMGYEIAGGLGVKMACPQKNVLVLVGDGSYLMMAQEIITSIQENCPLIILLINNHGYKSIGALSRSIGDHGFGTRNLRRSDDQLADDRLSEADANAAFLPVDLAKNAESMGAIVYKALTKADLEKSLSRARQNNRTTLIYTECDRYAEVENFSWWEVPISELSSSAETQEAYKDQLEQRSRQRYYSHLKKDMDGKQ